MPHTFAESRGRSKDSSGGPESRSRVAGPVKTRWGRRAEVLGRCSHHADQGEQIDRIRSEVLSASARPLFANQQAGPSAVISRPERGPGGGLRSRTAPERAHAEIPPASERSLQRPGGSRCTSPLSDDGGRSPHRGHLGLPERQVTGHCRQPTRCLLGSRASGTHEGRSRTEAETWLKAVSRQCALSNHEPADKAPPGPPGPSRSAIWLPPAPFAVRIAEGVERPRCNDAAHLALFTSTPDCRTLNARRFKSERSTTQIR